MKKISYYFTLLAIFIVLGGCYKDPIYSIEGIGVQYITTATFNPTSNDSATQHWQNFGVRCYFHIVDHTASNSVFGYSYSHFRNEVICRDPITNIFISADEDFDNEHPAGSTLNELFYYRPYKFAESVALTNDGKAPKFTAEDGAGYPSNYFPNYADFILTKPPSGPIEITFQIKVIKESGKEYIAIPYMPNGPIILE